MDGSVTITQQSRKDVLALYQQNNITLVWVNSKLRSETRHVLRYELTNETLAKHDKCIDDVVYQILRTHRAKIDMIFINRKHNWIFITFGGSVT